MRGDRGRVEIGEVDRLVRGVGERVDRFLSGDGERVAGGLMRGDGIAGERHEIGTGIVLYRSEIQIFVYIYANMSMGGIF